MATRRAGPATRAPTGPRSSPSESPRTRLRKCQHWRGKTALDPGKYEVVLEPTAVGMLLSRMHRPSMRGRLTRAAPTSRSAAAAIVSAKSSSTSASRSSAIRRAERGDRAVHRCRSAGHARVWVENGVLKTLSYSRFWATKQVAPTRASRRTSSCQAATRRRHDHVGQARRADHPVLVHPALNPRIVSHTGLTRDGTFLIENGRSAGRSRTSGSISRCRPARQRRDAGSPDACRRQRKQFGRRADCCARAQSPGFFLSSVSDAI